MSIYHHQPSYQPVSNGRPTKLGDIENLRLLSVSDSGDEAELKQRGGGSPKISKNVPDLKLTMPSGSTGANRVLSTAGKIRKKIRLKRYKTSNLTKKIVINFGT